jgi:hypothetical protein
MVHLPLLVTDYDLNNFAHVFLPDQQYEMLFASLEKNKPHLEKSVFRPMSMQHYNSRVVNTNDDCKIIEPIDFEFDRTFFTQDELSLYESEWKRGSTFPPAGKSELFLLWKQATEMNAQIEKLNRVFRLIHQRSIAENYQNSLKRHQFMAISKFFVKTVKAFKTSVQKPVACVEEGLAWLVNVKTLNSAFTLPFLVQLLNRISTNLGKWVSPDMEKRFEKILNQRFGSPKFPRGKIMSVPLCETAVTDLTYSKTLPFGGRLLRLLPFLDKFDLIEGKFAGSNLGQRLELVGQLLVASRNSLHLETLLFLDKVIFVTDFSKLLRITFQRRWCVLTQGLWVFVADDPVLSHQCNEIVFS